MKKTLFTLFAALVCATTVLAQEVTSVTTDSELRTAVKINGVSIKLTADIDLSNSTLSIESGLTVTINFDGHTLDRKLTKRGDGGGQVITGNTADAHGCSIGISCSMRAALRQPTLAKAT